MHPQLLLPFKKISIGAQIHVVIFVRGLSKKIDTVKLVEHLEAYSISFYSGLGVLRSEVRFRHLYDLQFLISDHLVANCISLVIDIMLVLGYLLSYERANQALSTSGLAPTYGEFSPMVLLYLIVWYSTAFAAGAVVLMSQRYCEGNVENLTICRKLLNMPQS